MLTLQQLILIKINDEINSTHLQIINKLLTSNVSINHNDEELNHASCEKKLRSEINSAICSLLRMNTTTIFYFIDR